MADEGARQERPDFQKIIPRQLADAHIDRLNAVDGKLLSELLATFQKNQSQLERWEQMFQDGKLDADQREAFQHAKHTFFDLYHDLVRFCRMQEQLMTDKFLSDKEKQELREEMNRVQFGLDNSPLVAVMRGRPGIHTHESPLVARHIVPFERYVRFARCNPAFLRFGMALYPGNTEAYENVGIQQVDSPVFEMIPSEMKIDANAHAKKLYERYCAKNGLEAKQQVEFPALDSIMFGGAAEVRGMEDRRTTWNQKVFVETDKFGDGFVVRDQQDGREYYIPPHITALHEMGHAERVKVFQQVTAEGRLPESIVEIAQVIDQVINQDEVYKTSKGLPMDSVVEYPKKLPTDKNGGISLGELANMFRTLKKTYGTIEECLMSEEGQQYVRRYFKDAPL